MHRSLKVCALASLLAVSGALSASAADLPLKAPSFVPPQAWMSGFYVAVNAAGGATNGKFDFLEIPGMATGNLHPSGALVGGTLGFGAFTGPGGAFFGLEADADFDMTKLNTPCVVVLNCTMRGSFLLTQRIVIGMPLGAQAGALQSKGIAAPSQWPIPINLPQNLTQSNIMPYLTAGVAERELKACVTGLPVNGCAQDWIIGWAAGPGVRVPVTTNFSFDLSYLYVGYNKSFTPAAMVVVFPAKFQSTNEQVLKAAIVAHF